MPSNYIPEEHELLRYVQYSKLRRDGEADDAVIGVLWTAFQLRDGEEYLSATWIDFFDDVVRADRVAKAVHVIRRSNLKVTKKSGFAIGQAKAISDGCAKHNATIRMIHESEGDNEAHVAVRRWPRENRDLFELMADETWAEWLLNSSIP